MADVSKFILDNTEINVKDTTARGNIGNLANLTTTDKTSIVAALNEVAGEVEDVGVTYDSSTETITFTTT